MRIRLFFLSLIPWIIGGPASSTLFILATGSFAAFAIQKPVDCEMALSGAAATYMRLIQEGLRPQSGKAPVLARKNLQTLSLKNLNPLANATSTAENLSLKKAMLQVERQLTSDDRVLILREIESILTAGATDLDVTAKAEEFTARTLAPQIVQTFPDLNAINLLLHQNHDGEVWMAARFSDGKQVVGVQIVTSDNFNFENSKTRFVPTEVGAPTVLHSSKDGRLWVAVMSFGQSQLQIENLSGDEVFTHEPEGWKIENLEWIEDASGQKFIVMLQRQRNSYRYEILQVGASMKSIGVFQMGENYGVKDLRVLPTGEAVFTAVDREAGLFVFDLSSAQKVARFPSYRACYAFPFKSRAGVWMVAMIPYQVAQAEGHPIQFLKENAPPLNLPGYITSTDQLITWHETNEGRILFTFHHGSLLAFVEPRFEDPVREHGFLSKLKNRLLGPLKPAPRTISAFDFVKFGENANQNSLWLQHLSGEWSLIVDSRTKTASYRFNADTGKIESEFELAHESENSNQKNPVYIFTQPTSRDLYSVRYSQALQSFMFTDIHPGVRARRVSQFPLSGTQAYSNVLQAPNGDAIVALIHHEPNSSSIQILKLIGSAR